MRDRALFGVVVAVALAATLVDFTARILSVAVDGLFMAGLLWLVWTLLRHKDAQIEDLKQRLSLSQRQTASAIEAFQATPSRRRAF